MLHSPIGRTSKSVTRSPSVRTRSGFFAKIGVVTAMVALISCNETDLTSLTSSSEVPTAPLTTSESVSSYNYSGGAYGTFAFVDNEQGFVRADRTAVTGLDCVTEPGVDEKNNVASVDAPELFHAGATLNGGPAARTSATIHDLTMLGGAITANVITATATTGSSATGFYDDPAGSTFVSLKVGAVNLTGTVAPNTRIDLPGIGSVTLNEQVVTRTDSGARLTVNMIHVVMSQNNVLLIPWGTNIIVAHAESGVRMVSGILLGAAYGSKVDGSVVRLGESALAYMPCNGTDGATLHTEMGAISYKNILAFDGVRSTARGIAGATRTEGEMTSTITGIKVLDGRISADVIVADAGVVSANGSLTLSDAGSKLATLQVDGVTIDANAPANTQINVANVGTLWIHRLLHTSTTIEVRMLELVVEVPNSYDLPIGTTIQIAVARAGVR